MNKLNPKYYSLRWISFFNIMMCICFIDEILKTKENLWLSYFIFFNECGYKIALDDKKIALDDYTIALDDYKTALDGYAVALESQKYLSCKN